MNPGSFRIALTGCMALILAACNQVVAPTLPGETPLPPAKILPNVDTQMEPSTIFPTQEPEKDGTLIEQPTDRPLISGKEFQIETARQDLAQRLGVSIDSITVVAVIGQEFSADAFYCQVTKERIAKEESPQEVSGQSILLSASGRRYEYHASGQTVIFCRSLP